MMRCVTKSLTVLVHVLGDYIIEKVSYLLDSCIQYL